jgi:hypothetical protein
MSTKVTLAELAVMAVALPPALLVSSVAGPAEAKKTCQTRSGNTQMVNRTEINVKARV